jgi:GNAT superfamily N-acetyltransferase
MLFEIDGVQATEIKAENVPTLQQFFDANPEYFLSVTGQPPLRNQGHEEFISELPEGWPFTKKWAIGFLNTERSMVAVATIIADLLAPDVWNLGLFIVETRQHGKGIARPLYDALETWMSAHGAKWIRLGVVAGNLRGERFWERLGFTELRRTYGIEMGAKTQTMRVMAKPVAGVGLEEYLARVPRDRPDLAQ